MKKLYNVSAMGFVMVVLFGLTTAHAQEESQIKIKITREIDGEQKTYEGAYESEDQMKADENLQEFLGENDMKTNFWFGSAPNQAMRLHFDDEDSARFRFQFDSDDDDHSFFMVHPDDSTMKAFHLRMEDIAKSFEGMDEEMEAKMLKLHKRLEDMDFDFDFDFNSTDPAIELHLDNLMDHMKGLEKSFEIHIIKKITISDEVGDDFGKKGVVKESNKLELPDLNYFPNPSPNGQFKLKFKVPTEGELSIKIINLDGKEVFSRYFERFGGYYNESIDLSTQSEGLYLLEIQQDGKRLTRKIILN